MMITVFGCCTIVRLYNLIKVHIGPFQIVLHLIHSFSFTHIHVMEYLQSLELQRFLRVNVIPLGNTREEVVVSVQRQLSDRGFFF